jgi:acyl carrier protein
MSESLTRDEVLATVAQSLREVVGEQWISDIAITTETSFSDDLELESIEFIALAAKLRERYGHEKEFTDWMAGMELEQIIGLRVGDVVEFVLRCHSPQ